jgi:HEAT repeat protein
MASPAKRFGSWFIVVTIAFCCVFIAWALLKDFILERWYIREFMTSKGANRVDALRALARMKSMDALPLLFSCVVEEGRSVDLREATVLPEGIFIDGECFKAVMMYGDQAIVLVGAELMAADELTRFAATRVLWELGLKGAVINEVIVKALRDESELVRSNAACALCELEPLAAMAYLPVLSETIKDNRAGPELCCNYMHLMGKMKDAAKPYVLDIVGVLEDARRDINIRCCAVEALASMGTSARESLPALEQAEQSEELLGCLVDEALQAIRGSR